MVSLKTKAVVSQILFFLYLDIRFLGVHKLLDDFPQSVCVRKVASQWPWRWILVVLLSFHTACLDFLEVSAQRADLFCALLNKRKETNVDVLEHKLYYN